MNASLRRVLLLAFVMIALIAWWNLGIHHRIGPLGDSRDSKPEASGMASTARSVERVGEGPSQRIPRPTLSKSELEAESAVGSSKVHTIIPAGHSMVTGGYLATDGRREFTVITPHLVDNGSKKIFISTCLIKLTSAGLEPTGLKSLVTNRRKLEQHAEVWTSGDVEALMANRVGMEVVSRPSMYFEPGSPGLLRSKLMTTPGGGFNVQPDDAPADEPDITSMSIEANEAPNGGIELKLEITSGR
jgi:hypothetical protein